MALLWQLSVSFSVSPLGFTVGTGLGPSAFRKCHVSARTDVARKDNTTGAADVKWCDVGLNCKICAESVRFSAIKVVNCSV